MTATYMATQRPASDQASQAAVRRLVTPTPWSCSFVPSRGWPSWPPSRRVAWLLPWTDRSAPSSAPPYRSGSLGHTLHPRRREREYSDISHEVWLVGSPTELSDAVYLACEGCAGADQHDRRRRVGERREGGRRPEEGYRRRGGARRPAGADRHRLPARRPPHAAELHKGQPAGAR